MGEFGLSEKTLTVIRDILAEFPSVEKAILYGSRAMGTHRNGSDVDLTLVGENLDLPTLGKIAAKLEDSPIPYQVDLSLLDRIDHEELRQHIVRVGVVFYQKDAGRPPS